MDRANTSGNLDRNTDLIWSLEICLREAVTIPADTAMQYQEPVNDTAEPARYAQATSNEFTLGKLRHTIQPEVGTTALAVGSTQGFQLLGMFPELAGLDIVDISETPVTAARAVPELLTRIQLLTGRLPTTEQMVFMFRDDGSLQAGTGEYIYPLLHRILALPLETPEQQHTFSEAELEAIDRDRLAIASDLERQLHDNPDSWLQPQHLERITSMYREGKIQIHRGNIAGGQAIDALKHRQPPFGLIYLSNVIGIGHGLDQAEQIAAQLSQLPISDAPIFVQAAESIRLKADDHPWQRPNGYYDWPYLVQHGLASFIKYTRPDNPDLQAARLRAVGAEESGGIPISRYPEWIRRPELFHLSEDGVLVEEVA